MDKNELITYIKKNSEFYADVDFSTHNYEQLHRIYVMLEHETGNRLRNTVKRAKEEQLKTGS